MKFSVLLLTLLGTAAAQLGQTIATVRTPEVSYVLTVKIRGPDFSRPYSETSYILRALRTKDLKTIWTAAVEPEAREIILVKPVLLANSCFSGAYIGCRTQAFDMKTGKQLWLGQGIFRGVKAQFVLLADAFFIRDDEQGSFYGKFQVVRLIGGTPKVCELRVPPRGACRGQVELVKVQEFSNVLLKILLRDSCGTFTRTFR
jgi:hypothetical protein